MKEQDALKHLYESVLQQILDGQDEISRMEKAREDTSFEVAFLCGQRKVLHEIQGWLGASK
jgi:hypothetical protein